MKPCPSCGYIVPRAWTECRRCGAALEFSAELPSAPAKASAAQRSSATVAALALAPPAPLPSAPRPTAARDTMLPLVPPTIDDEPEPAPSRVDRRKIAIVAIAVVCVIGGYQLISRALHHDPPEPTVLAPRQPAAGIPTNLSDVVRIAAESARHTALSTVMSVHTSVDQPVTTAQLAAAQPSYQWVTGEQPSTTNTVISITSVPGFDVLAVSGTSKDVCAFGRWSPASGPEYVTMTDVASCSASAAPTVGWSTIAGGSAQDLPDPNAFG